MARNSGRSSTRSGSELKQWVAETKYHRGLKECPRIVLLCSMEFSGTVCRGWRAPTDRSLNFLFFFFFLVFLFFQPSVEKSFIFCGCKYLQLWTIQRFNFYFLIKKKKIKSYCTWFWSISLASPPLSCFFFLILHVKFKLLIDLLVYFIKIIKLFAFFFIYLIYPKYVFISPFVFIYDFTLGVSLSFQW